MDKKSYVADSTQNCDSQPVKIARGQAQLEVPQGSVLGPLLFVLYTKDISAIIRRHGSGITAMLMTCKLYFYCIPEEAESLTETFLACTDRLCK